MTCDVSSLWASWHVSGFHGLDLMQLFLIGLQAMWLQYWILKLVLGVVIILLEMKLNDYIIICFEAVQATIDSAKWLTQCYMLCMASLHGQATWLHDCNEDVGCIHVKLVCNEI